MKLIYKGKFSGNPDDIPHGEHKPGAVKFKEPEMEKFTVIMRAAANILALIAFFVLLL